jgi:uncharacterized membrane protein YfcA
MTWHELQPLAVFIVVLIASIFSGMAGGGGGFIILPFLIAFGLTPQQAVATGKLSAFGLGIGSVAAFKTKYLAKPKLLAFFILLSALISLFVPHIFRSLNGQTFQLAIGALILALVQVVWFEKTGLRSKKTSSLMKYIGTIFMAIVLFLQGIFSGGVGSLNNVVLMTFFGLSTLQANATRRIITLALNTFIVLTLALTTDFIIYRLAIAGMAGSFIGGYIGSEIAIKEGEKFAKMALAMFMLVSGIWLVLTA